MTPEIENALKNYVSTRKLERLRDAERHLREMIGEARERAASVETWESERRSRMFLEALVRDR
jgi:hypothetical protein